MYYKNLLQAVNKTGNTIQKKSHLLCLNQIIQKLNNHLQKRIYKTERFSCFAVQDPKIREIFAPAFPDRIVHHLLIDNIEQELDKNFIFDSFANRKNKGVHQAVSRLQSFLKKSKTDFYLQADIKTFFPSIDKEILEKIYTQKIQNLKNFSDKEKDFFLYLGKTILRQNPLNPTPIFTGNKHLLQKVPLHKSLFNNPLNKGLPIGCLTSQFFANLYLDELDQFVKHTLKVKYYLRYVDDFVLLGNNPQTLQEQLKSIENFLQNKLKIELNPKKTILQQSDKGINFLGYIVRKKYLLIRKRTVKSFKRNLYFFNYLLNPRKFPFVNPPYNSKLAKAFKNRELIPPIEVTPVVLKKMLATINSYYGMLRFANTFKLRKNLYKKHFHLLKRYLRPKNREWKSIIPHKERYF